ncbi:carbonic anhydrase [Crucibulum laeve]|uniref:Carbonic anhydrase n=1 Tax=Crucibulum laeve TaxID=68775 RepID=A0A5C3LQ75_9AGAR|nr:carbonic anhydrase [Crucibulum laeve]
MKFCFTAGISLFCYASIVSAAPRPLFAAASKDLGSTTKAGHHGHSHKYPAEIQELFKGNIAFRKNMTNHGPDFLKSLAVDGQKPPFMVIDCSDSRSSEEAIFSVKPGTMFTTGNIANQFHEEDLTTNAVLSYAVETLAVKHVILMGHYGCGGVAAAMAPLGEKPTHPAHCAVQEWIKPIRDVYQRSERPEIIAHRKKMLKSPTQKAPGLHDPAFRALVEENVKANVRRIADSAVIQDHFAALSAGSDELQKTEVHIHGWVYDIENGEVTDLGITFGPSGLIEDGSPFKKSKY